MKNDKRFTMRVRCAECGVIFHTRNKGSKLCSYCFPRRHIKEKERGRKGYDNKNKSRGKERNRCVL